MERCNKSDETLDRLSGLHQSLIFLILSHVPMRDVVRTSILSKHWKDLWLTLPYLNFFELNKRSSDSRDFINRALMLWKGTNIQSMKFSFVESFDPSLHDDIGLWVRFAEEKKLEELYIQIPCNHSQMRYWAHAHHPPRSLYSCSSIKMLTLIGYDLGICVNVQWHQLKCLKLDRYEHDEYSTKAVINRLLSSCPQLETFVLRLFGGHWSLSFQSTSLKMLSICSTTHCTPSVLTICAPNLEALVISGAPYDKCLLMDVSSLTNVTLDFGIRELTQTLRQILPAFHHVEAVTLSASCYKLLPVIAAKYLLSPLMDVKFLRLISSGPIKPTEILGVLESFPMVERLVIDWKLIEGYEAMRLERLVRKQSIGSGVGLKFDEGMLKPFLTQLKRVEIRWSSSDEAPASMFEFIELLLKHGAMMRKIVIRKGRHEVITSQDMFLVAQEMASQLQRSFPAVEIELFQN